ncbi:hypothetical protein [Microbacterium testaceum]|uniref:hypothetical protein n=1 Tax=Microbacterium testaceum TaxID=2033 RepID=UPI0010571580|nr:hypothetical protein [Microbacterium testaceum]
MCDLESIALSAGDYGQAVGTLTHTQSGYLLAAHMEGRLHGPNSELGGDTALVIGLDEPPLGEVVTVRGLWNGSQIVDAELFDAHVGVKPPPLLDPATFRDMEGVAERGDILRAEVLDACDELRGTSLLSFVAVPGPRGWYGLACGTDRKEALARLSPLVDPYLVVTESEWTLAELEEAERLISESEDVRGLGVFWDDRGRYRAHCVLHHLEPGLASTLRTLPKGTVHVETWLTRTTPAGMAGVSTSSTGISPASSQATPSSV